MLSLQRLIMRLKGVIFCILAVLGSIFLVCSRSDVISGVADGVVSDMDPTLTDTLNRFVRVNLDSGDVDSAYSLPAKADPALSTTFADSGVIVGVNGEGDTLAAYIQYDFAADTSRYDSLELEGVYLYFRAADSIDLSDTISLYWVKKLPETAPVNSEGSVDKHPDADKDVFTEPCPTDPDDGGSGDTAGDDGDGGDCVIETVMWPLKFTIGGDDGVDSVKLPDSIAKKIFDARASNASTGGAVFAFSLYYGKKEVRRIQNPDMVIAAYKVKEPESGKSVGDTLHFMDTIRAGFSRFTVFEDASSAEERAKKAYSSQYTKRTAVFEINLSKIKNRLSGLDGEYINLNAVITLEPRSNPDSGAGNYRVFVSDTKFKDSDTASLNELFGGKSSSLLRPVKPYNTLSIGMSQSINPSLQRDFLDKNKEYLYIYLRADSDGGVIIWEEPRLETVFTPSR